MQSEKEKSTEIPGWTYTYATTDDGRSFRLAQDPCGHFPSMAHSHGLFGK